MIRAIRRDLSIYLSIFSMVPKVFMAYQMWFWIGQVLNIIGMAIMVFFWRAVYNEANTIADLSMVQTLNYIMLAFIFMPLTDLDVIWEMGNQLRDGTIAHQLLRPIDFQMMFYAQNLGGLVTRLLLQIPIALIATVFFGLQWPSDIWTWGAFFISALLGYTVLFFFHWFLSCLTFYTTEVWGLGVLVLGFTTFLSGALVPLTMMPDWMQSIVYSIPFAQAIAVPVNLLTGITPPGDAPRVWLIQLLWVAGMWVASNLFFRVAVRKITVQGG